MTNASLAVAAITLLATGCEALGRADGASPGPTVAPAPSSASPTVPAATPEPSATQEPAGTPRPAGFAGRLLPAEQLAGATWTSASTERSEGSPLAGTCHKFELTSIGGWKVARRLYAPADGGTSQASATVVEFPDAGTAKRAYAVLEAWRNDCAQPDAQVGRFVPLRLGQATGGWYVVTYGSTYDAQALARQGSRIVVLTLRTEGPPPTGDPIATALQRSVALLG